MLDSVFWRPLACHQERGGIILSTRTVESNVFIALCSEVLQLRRAAEDELQSALSRSERRPGHWWSMPCGLMKRNLMFMWVFWHQVFLEFSSDGKMWWRWFLCRRCQTEADLERLQAAVEECKRLDVWQKLRNVSKRYSFATHGIESTNQSDL